MSFSLSRCLSSPQSLKLEQVSLRSVSSQSQALRSVSGQSQVSLRLSGQSQVSLRSVSCQSQVSLRSVSCESHVSLMSVSCQSHVSLRSLCAYFVRQTKPKILCLVLEHFAEPDWACLLCITPDFYKVLVSLAHRCLGASLLNLSVVISQQLSMKSGVGVKNNWGSS